MPHALISDSIINTKFKMPELMKKVKESKQLTPLRLE
jgi:hypothetical protein